jgi:hypothetical protein
MIVAFGGSIFQIRGTYQKIFGNLLDEIEQQKEVNPDEARMFKLKYTLNLLPGVTYEPGSDESTTMSDLLEELCNSDELDIFRTDVVIDLFQFSWDKYAKHLHYYGISVHFLYVIFFTIYIDQVFN